MNFQNLVNLTPILAVLATLAGSGYSTSGLLTWMRRAALNAWLSGLTDDSRAAIYQGIMLVLNYAIIGGLALATHYTLSWNLAGSVFVAALASTVGAHGLYNYNQKTPSLASVAPATPLVSGMPLVAPDMPTTLNLTGQSGTIVPASAPDADAPILVQPEPAPAQ